MQGPTLAFRDHPLSATVSQVGKAILTTFSPSFSPPHRSLELLFSSSHNAKLLYGDAPKSPRASRKFSSPPPLAIGTSSPSRRRKLSLNIPIITGGKALELASLGCSSDGYTNIHSPISPFGKTTLDTGKLCIASSLPKTPEEVETPTPEKPGELSAFKKQSEWMHEQNHPISTYPCES